MIKLVEVCTHNKYTNSSKEEYSLREVFINPEHVVCIREDASAWNSLQEGLMPDGLDSRTRFSKLHLSRGNNGLDIIVVGEPNQIKEKLGIVRKQRTLLKG